jgi:hypothetical protein
VQNAFTSPPKISMDHRCHASASAIGPNTKQWSMCYCVVRLSSKILTFMQEIISNILFYEKRYLLNGGMSQKSAEMQDLLGIQFREVGSSYQFISKPAPVLNHIQALKVCNLVCIYKLAEIVSIDNNSVHFGAILHSGTLESTACDLPSEATQIMTKISDWPKILKVFNDSHCFSEPSGSTVPGLTSQPASLQLLHALSDANGRKLAAKIHHNILIAAAHIAYIKEHQVNGDHVSESDLPDLPDLTSLWVFTFRLLSTEWHSSLLQKVLFGSSES